MVSILRKGLYAIGERINGWNVFERLDQFHEMERWDPGRIQDFKLDNLKRLAHHAYAHVPLYRQLWDKEGVHPGDIKDLDGLSNFPVVTKRMVREAGDLALDSRYQKKKLRKVWTSGTSGEPLTLYKDKGHHSWFLAGIFLGWSWAGWEPGDPILKIWATEKIGLKTEIENRVFNYNLLRVNEFNDAFFRKFVLKEKSIKPVIIRANPFTLYHIARYLIEKEIRTVRLKAVCSTTNVLYSSYRETIQKAFGCRVFDGYGAAEMIVAHQCEEGSYHILPSGHLEVDSARQEFGDNGPRHLLLTSLTNYAMPLIRYDIGDMGRMGSDACACGKTWEFLETVYGRDEDFILTPSGNYIYWDHVERLFKTSEGIDQFQLVQEERSRISVRLVTNPNYNREVQEQLIIDYLMKKGGRGLAVEIDYVKAIPPAPSGKYRCIISRVMNSAQ